MDKNNIILSEYSLIKNELSNLFQKSAILLTISSLFFTFFISLSVGLSVKYSNYYFILLVPSFFSLLSFFH